MLSGGRGRRFRSSHPDQPIKAKTGFLKYSGRRFSLCSAARVASKINRVARFQVDRLVGIQLTFNELHESFHFCYCVSVRVNGVYPIGIRDLRIHQYGCQLTLRKLLPDVNLWHIDNAAAQTCCGDEPLFIIR